MIISDQAIGNALHTVLTLGLAWYLVWMLAMPFVDHDHAFHRFFPPWEYGVAAPALLLGLLCTVLLTVAAVAIAGIEPGGGEAAGGLRGGATRGALGHRAGSPPYGGGGLGGGVTAESVSPPHRRGSSGVPLVADR